MNKAMKHTIYIFACVLALSCSKGAVSEKPIVLRMPSGTGSNDAIYVTAVKEDGSFLFQAQSFGKGDGENYSGDHYWPVSGKLSFYADNCGGSRRSGSHGGSCMEILMEPGLDTVTGKAENISNGSSVSLSLGHPFARLYALSLSSADGSTISVNSVRVVGRTGGWYCLRHMVWTESSSPETVSFPATLYSCGDLLFVPGNASIILNYTATVGSSSQTYEKTAGITLEAGKKTTVYATVGADALPITADIQAETWIEPDTVNILL